VAVTITDLAILHRRNIENRYYVSIYT